MYYVIQGEQLMNIKNMIKFFTDKELRFGYLNYMGFFNHMLDKEYLEKRYKITFGKNIDWENPKTFNEKLQWLKLYNRKPEYTTMVDKYAVREYIADKLGEEYLIPLLGVWNNPNDIDFTVLPEQFVLKCNHNSGMGMCICKNKNELNIDNIKNKLKSGLKQNYYLTSREWPYKNVKRKIIAEKYIEDSKGEFVDYKFFAFNGYVPCVMVCIDRHINDTKFYFFDKDWNLLKLNKRGKEASPNFTLPKPKNISEMFKIAEKLSKDIPFVRIDLYNADGKIYFGEITFFPDSGFDKNLLCKTDEYFGKLINLKGIKK